MVDCSYCRRKIKDIPFKCHRCTREYCSEHRLPEDHNCPSLLKQKEKNQDRWKKTFSEIFSDKGHGKKFVQKKKRKKDSHQRKRKPLEKLNHFFTSKTRNLSRWLNSREHRGYNFERRFNYLLRIILPLAISIVAYVVFYSNAQKLNEINLWIIRLGGILILISIFFIIKYGIKFIKELINILKRQKNWLKYLIVILIFFLLWQAYTNKDIVLNPLFDVYNNTNFSYFAPVGLGNFSLESGSNPSSTYSNTNNGNSGFSDFVRGVFDPKSQIDISELEQEVHRRINTERTNNGLRPLSWDSKIVQIAREHSEDMVTRNFYSHDNPDGEDPTDRGNRHGYDCTKDYGSYYTYGLAENIAITPIYSDVISCGSTTSLNSLAECIVDGWMTSPGHRENILTSTYTKTGIGIAYSKNDEAYSTQNFC